MPRLGATTVDGTLVAWSVAVGDRVEAGTTVVVVEPDKAQVEVGAPSAGVLRHVHVEAGTTVPCGALLGAIAASPDEPFDAAAFHRAHHRPDVAALPLPDVPPPLPPR